MIPKYSVGEVVIVQSPYHPEGNGEYEILDIFTYEQYQIYCNGEFKSTEAYFIYKLEGYLIKGKKNPERSTDCVSEPSLRKRHEPSQMSFQSLIQSINSPEKQES